MKRRLVAFLGWAALAAPVAGQDNHYWTSQFGNRARLLGGSVVGSATDLSAIYYNPGALALVPKPELLLSGTVFQYERVGVSNALGPNSNVADSRFAMVPSLFAGEIHFDALGENRVGYAFLTRQDAEFRINERADITDRLQAAIPGLAFASTGVQYESRLREYWVGGSWSRKIGERIGFGVSPFIAVRNQRGPIAIADPGTRSGGRRRNRPHQPGLRLLPLAFAAEGRRLHGLGRVEARIHRDHAESGAIRKR